MGWMAGTVLPWLAIGSSPRLIFKDLLISPTVDGFLSYFVCSLLSAGAVLFIY